MAYIKRELLECLIRECICELLDHTNEADETIGAAAPPADGQGTADQPALSQPESPLGKVPSSGVILVNPRDTSKLQPLPLKFTDDAKLERDLFKVGSTIGGPRIKTSLNAVRSVKDAIQNPSSPVYVFIGKYDPDSDEVFVMADKDLNVAREESVTPTVSKSSPSDTFSPITADADEFANRLSSAGQTPRSELDEIKKSIKKMVKDAFSI